MGRPVPKHRKISEDARNAYALHQIRELLDELFMRRHSPECTTVAAVRAVRAEIIERIRAALP